MTGFVHTALQLRNGGICAAVSAGALPVCTYVCMYVQCSTDLRTIRL